MGLVKRHFLEKKKVNRKILKISVKFFLPVSNHLRRYVWRHTRQTVHSKNTRISGKLRTLHRKFTHTHHSFNFHLKNNLSTLHSYKISFENILLPSMQILNKIFSICPVRLEAIFKITSQFQNVLKTIFIPFVISFNFFSFFEILFIKNYRIN